jgi:adenosylcobyric acid synthase
VSSNANKPARCLSILGTGSDVGKSIVVTALCRIFANQGLRVAPYKAQNMSNNSYVTRKGGEMGRAQVVQAEAAGVELHTNMNPVLLKPCTDTGAQVIVHGKVQNTRQARDYFADTTELFVEARKALDRLRSQYELVVMEGAGSCAEVNLRERDFVNFRMAHACDAPVILVADIDRGGVFAQIIGSLAIIPPEDRGAVKGIIINRFRGDASLFDEGISYIKAQTGLPVLGLIPYFYHIEIDSEDGMPLDVQIDPPGGPQSGQVNIAVICFPHISNFTDFNPLSRDPAVGLHYLTRPRSLQGYDLLLLPGTKNVRADKEWMSQLGWDEALHAFAAEGGQIGGVCGGYQMLGKSILDPEGIEGKPGQTHGLNLLPLTTTLAKDKILTRTEGLWCSNSAKVEGYEIHMGLTTSSADLEPVLKKSDGSMDGGRTEDGQIWGTYLHGLFDNNAFRQTFLKELAPDRYRPSSEDGDTSQMFKDRQYDLLAEHFEKYLDMDRLARILKAGR